MARVLYVDCFAGAAGDMLLGALLDLGVPLDGLRDALGSLGVSHALAVSQVQRAGLTATRVQVFERGQGESPEPDHGGHHHHHDHHRHDHHDHDHGQQDAAGAGLKSRATHHHDAAHHAGHGHRSLEEIAQLIGHSNLSPAGKERAIRLFRRIGEAEAAIHGTTLDRIHLHEVGALDSIIDIVGAVYAFEWLGIDDVVASPLNVGAGTVTMAHGTFPVPAPATLRLLVGAPVYSTGVDAELVTPTGALLVSDYARRYGPMPAMRVERVGYGAGTRELDPLPNVVRLVIGERAAADTVEAGGAAGEPICRIECEIDDMNPQLFGPLSDRLFAAGAVDVFLTAVQMKKGRPGTLVTVLVPDGLRSRMTDLLFDETTTLGVRWDSMRRETLEREHHTVTVEGGDVRIKVARRHGRVQTVMPEFDDCRRVADATGRAVRAVQADALRAWHARGGPDRGIE